MIFSKKDSLHALLYFVANAPGKSNLSSEVPLVGTGSYKTFLSWLAEMNVDITRVRLYNQIDNPFEGISGASLNAAIRNGHIKVIALGVNAQKYLLKTAIYEFYVLPHPSSRNRKLNDKEFVKKILGQCEAFIYRGSAYGKKEKRILKAVRSCEAPAQQGFKEREDNIQES